jgi:uncharacterized protein (UPF0332 family)
VIDPLAEELHVQSGMLLTLAPTQANLRRSISTNYYAVFHLLIADAIELWNRPEHHSALARQFDHKRMKVASAELKLRLHSERKMLGLRQDGIQTSMVLVAANFVELQEKRHEADYDVSRSIAVEEAKYCDFLTSAAVEAWKQVRDEPIAHDYLYSLLFRDR